MANDRVDKDTPIVIHKDSYNSIASKADEKRMTIKAYANNLVDMCLQRYAYLEGRFPRLKLWTQGTNTFIVHDSENPNLKPTEYVVSLDEDGEYACHHGDKKSKDCDHVKFIKMSPGYDPPA